MRPVLVDPHAGPVVVVVAIPADVVAGIDHQAAFTKPPAKALGGDESGHTGSNYEEVVHRRLFEADGGWRMSDGESLRD